MIRAQDWARLPESFDQQIEQEYVVVVTKDGKRSEGRHSGPSSEWREYEFAALCDITRGASPRPIHDWISQEGIPWLRISDASAAGSRFIKHTRERIRPDGSTKSVSVLPGDLILSNSATPGIPKFVSIEACIHDGWLLLRNLRHIDKLFCYYLLLFERPRLVSQGSGTVFTNLKTDILKKHRVTIPPLPEQRVIANILGTLDDKIELNRRMNETLEAMARALFKSWFVNFDPVRAKMEGRWRRGESLPGLPAKYYDLFPDRLVESELGEIPVAWRVKELGEVVNVVGGTTPSTKVIEYWEGGTHCWATPKDLSNLSSPVLLDTARKITNAGLHRISSGLLPPGTVLLSSRAPIGYLAISEEPVAINQGFIAMPPRDGLSNLFMLCWCNAFQEEILNYASGTTFLEISKRSFRRIPLVLPDKEVMTTFDDYACQFHQRIVSNERESHALAAQRDALLPKLVSGEVRVQVGEASALLMTLPK